MTDDESNDGEIRISVTNNDDESREPITISEGEHSGNVIIEDPDGEKLAFDADRIEVGPEACVEFFLGHKWDRSATTTPVMGFSTITTRRCRLCGIRQRKSETWENIE